MPDITPLAVTCPKTGKPALDMGSYYTFSGFPGVYCNKTIASRQMAPEEYALLLAGRTLQLEGFLSKAGKTFAAKLVFDPGAKKFNFDFGAKGVPTKQLCPKAGTPILEAETYYQFPGYPGVYFNKTVAKRVMSIADYLAALSTAKPVFLDGFLSKEDKPFSAALVLDDTGKRMNFVFPPRENHASAKPKARTAGTHNADKEETASPPAGGKFSDY